jgi:hypothetical protein
MVINYAVKIVAYPKKENYGSINDSTRPENAELMMIKLLSYFIVNRQTPHLVIPFGTFDTSIENFEKSITKYVESIEEKIKLNENIKKILDTLSINNNNKVENKDNLQVYILISIIVLIIVIIIDIVIRLR